MSDEGPAESAHNVGSHDKDLFKEGEGVSSLEFGGRSKKSRSDIGKDVLQAVRTRYRITLTNVREGLSRQIHTLLGDLLGAYHGLGCVLQVEADQEQQDRSLLFCAGVIPESQLRELFLTSPNVDDAKAFKRPSIMSDWSSVSVPVCGPDGTLLGVLLIVLDPGDGILSNIELNRLAIDAMGLSLPLICFRKTNWRTGTGCPWAPVIGEWTLRDFLADVCHDIVRVMEENDPSSSFSCAIWNIDQEKSTLWVDATHGYDYEHLTRVLGRWESFTQRVARLEPGDAYIGPMPKEFVCKEKAARAGLSNMFSIPIYAEGDCEDELSLAAFDLGVWESLGRLGSGRLLEDDEELQPAASHVLHIYRFKQHSDPADVSTLPDENCAAELGVMLEDYLRAFQDTLEQAVLAELDASMSAARKEWMGWTPPVKPRIAFATFHALKEVLAKCFDAQGCSIFRWDADRHHLVLASTTGVTSEGTDETEGRHDTAGRMFYDCSREDDRGLMWWCHENTGQVIRMHTLEEGSDDFESSKRRGCVRIVRKHMEDLSPDTEDRRFLAAGVKSASTALVFRMVRPSNRPPFSKENEALLNMIVEFCKERDVWLTEEPNLCNAMNADASVTVCENDGQNGKNAAPKRIGCRNEPVDSVAVIEDLGASI